jgi:RNA polymerase sigma-70 factor (ECF subfamily)
MTTGDLRQELFQHIDRMRRYALVLCRDRDQAEDLVQDSLVRAIDGAHTWRPGEDLRRWLFAILHNTFVNGFRRDRLKREVFGALRVVEEHAASAGQVDAVQFRQTMEALEQLPVDQRQVLMLIAVEGMSYQEAADSLGIPLGTLMSRLGRGRAALREATNRPVKPGLKIVR